LAKPLTPKARSFYDRYVAGYDDLVAAAALVEQQARTTLAPHNFELHLISARAKSPASALKKIRSKGYGDPRWQLTDQIGLRVIVYFENDVDRVAAALRETFEVDEKRSEDKRVALGLTKFGYRSVHLIARLRHPSEWSPLKDRWFEVQVRSILEHAWAEIEHELVYKSGIEYPEVVLRKFAALAGAAEVLDQQFLALRGERDLLIEHYKTTYATGGELGENLDAVRLLGLLEAVRPDGLSWRQAEAGGRPYPPRVEATCVEALEACGVSTGTALIAMLRDKRFLAAAGDFASSESTSIENISHLATVVLIVGAADRKILDEQFLEMRSTVDLYVPTLAQPG